MGTNTEPASSTSVSVEEVRHIADLSNLRLTPEEEVAMRRDLSAILSYVAELKELDTAAVEPMAQVAEVLQKDDRAGGDSRDDLRPDALRGSLPREAAMAAAPETDGAFFKVPKVIER